MDFFDAIESRSRAYGTSLCVGLDPRVAPDSAHPQAALLEATEYLIRMTSPYALCFKPNLAFYEAFGPEGLVALEKTIERIPVEIPIILDAKRGDIGPTAEAYAQALLGRPFCAGRPVAVTLNPYMGKDAFDPFLAYEGAGIFALCKTSNPDAERFQNVVSADRDEALYLKVARECCSWSPQIGLVVAGNSPESLRRVRKEAPRAWFLAPGIGAQGGDAGEALTAGAREDGSGILVMAARAVANAANPGEAARELRDSIERARDAVLSRRSGTQALGVATSASVIATTGVQDEKSSESRRETVKASLFRALIRTGCFKLGDFVLKSGKHSPFYIDLRRVISDPEVLALAGKAYAQAAHGCGCTRIAGIPAAALPLATAASLEMRLPMIWPRMPVKEHGTGNRVEGEFQPGEKVLLLDDLITTGLSKLEALQILRGEGLIVPDLVVLLERGKQGRRDMEAAGVRLHSFAHVRELFAVCESEGLIDSGRRKELEAFVDSE